MKHCRNKKLKLNREEIEQLNVNKKKVFINLNYKRSIDINIKSTGERNHSKNIGFMLRQCKRIETIHQEKRRLILLMILFHFIN